MASLTVSTGLIGIVVALIRKGRPRDMDNGNRALFERLERIERIVERNERAINAQGRDIAHLKGQLGQ